MPVKPSDAENRNDNERKQHMKKRLLICLLIMTLLAAAACTEKKPEPKETAANTSTETVQTTETAAETKEKGLTDDEKRDFVCKVFNEEETDPFSWSTFGKKSHTRSGISETGSKVQKSNGFTCTKRS